MENGAKSEPSEGESSQAGTGKYHIVYSILFRVRAKHIQNLVLNIGFYF